MNDFSNITVNFRETIRVAFKKEALSKRKFVLVVDDNTKVIGIVTDGDFRRAIWKSISLEEPIDTITNRNFIYFSENYNLDDVKEKFSSTNMLQIPILRDRILVDIIFRKDFDKSELRLSKAKLNLPVVIMAGGIGKRLDPFTRILPKPLIPIGEKPVIEIIMEKFAEYGITHFYVSLNHKARMIKAFFEDNADQYNISYIEEDKPLGTAGALRFLENKIESPFFVTNCDIIIDDENYDKIYKFHKEGNYSLTLVGSMQHHVVPYGVCEIESSGELKEIREKPVYDFLVNTGMYILNPDVLEYIPANEYFDITDLITAIKLTGKRIGVYPISEKSWIDIGQWSEYKESLNKLLV